MSVNPKVFQISAFLLQYPDEDWRVALDFVRDELADLGEQTETILRPIIDDLRNRELESLQKHYVNTFDFGKKTNLYVTYALHGEQRERGSALLELKQIYKKAGWHMADEELPDYLPLMLEFASISTDGIGLLSRYKENLKVISDELGKAKSLYQNILNFIIMNVDLTEEQQPLAEGVGRHA
jgi:nitrate reductase delta subunit